MCTQCQGESPEGKGKERKLTFCTAAWAQGIEEPMRFANGERGILHMVQWMHRSGPYEARVGDRIDFYEGGEPFSEEDGPARKVIATAAIPREITRPLLLFLPAKKNSQGLRYEVLVIEDSTENFPFGSYRLQNLTKSAISGEIGNKQFELPPDRAVTLQLPLKTVEDVVVKANIKMGEKVVPCVETIWTYEPRLRKHVIFSWSDERNFIQLQSLSEYEKPQ